jgi:hypothetical protein
MRAALGVWNGVVMVQGFLSVSVDSDDLDRDAHFWEAILMARCAAVLTWGPSAGSAFFELPDGVRLILNAPPRSRATHEWLGLELEVVDPSSEQARLKSLGIAVSDVYETDGGSRAFVVTTPSGPKFRIGSRWPLPIRDADHSGRVPKERDLS